MANVLPVVRQLILCEDVFVDPANPQKISLLNLVFSIRSLESPPFPVVHKEFCALLMLTNGRGGCRLQIRVTEADTGESIHDMPTRVIDFGNDPLRVFGMVVRIRNCEFPRAGLYWVQVYCDNALVGESELLLRGGENES